MRGEPNTSRMITRTTVSLAYKGSYILRSGIRAHPSAMIYNSVIGYIASEGLPYSGWYMEDDRQDYQKALYKAFIEGHSMEVFVRDTTEFIHIIVL